MHKCLPDVCVFYSNHGRGFGISVKCYADSYGNEKLIRKWTKSVFFIRDQKFGQADSYGNEKLIRKWTKSTGLGAF